MSALSHFSYSLLSLAHMHFTMGFFFMIFINVLCLFFVFVVVVFSPMVADGSVGLGS